MSLLRAIEEAEVSPVLNSKIKNDSVLVDYKGAPSLYKAGTYDPNIRTLAYRDPKEPPQYDVMPNGEKLLKPGSVYEITLFPGLNEIPLNAWETLKPNLDSLMKPGRRLIVVPHDEVHIHNGEETLYTEKWVKERPLLVEHCKFSELDADRAATLLERCVDEKLLAKFEKAFPDDENVLSAIAVQRNSLENAIVRH